ncbi:hypothetical protein ACI2LM_12330 [Paenibacillus lautus]|uniref:hypothetical protein n=1 Tax=Paenibacillus lautus TaxID=1401 RepID=UPI00384E3D0B
MAQQIERRTTSVYKRYIEHSEQSSYIEIPFQMPPDVEEIHVSYQVDSHGGDPAKAVIDLGIRDAEIVRGWSGGIIGERWTGSHRMDDGSPVFSVGMASPKYLARCGVGSDYLSRSFIGH